MFRAVLRLKMWTPLWLFVNDGLYPAQTIVYNHTALSFSCANVTAATWLESRLLVEVILPQPLYLSAANATREAKSAAFPVSVLVSVALAIPGEVRRG